MTRRTALPPTARADADAGRARPGEDASAVRSCAAMDASGRRIAVVHAEDGGWGTTLRERR